MDHLQIDRLILHVPGLSEAEGARLAELVANGLVSAGVPAAAVSRPSLRLDLRAREGEGVEALSKRIVAEISRQLSASS